MQLLYEAALCIWQLTFLDEAAEVIAGTPGVVASLVEIARTAQKEKVAQSANMACTGSCCDKETVLFLL